MKKISTRAVSVFLIALVVIAGICGFVRNEFVHGRKWAMYFSSFDPEAEGELLDRDGEMLASFNRAGRGYAVDSPTRIANYHVTGDFIGMSGTGILTHFWSSAKNYSYIKGTYGKTQSSLTLSIDSDLNKMAYQLIRDNGRRTVLKNAAGQIVDPETYEPILPLTVEEETEELSVPLAVSIFNIPAEEPEEPEDLLPPLPLERPADITEETIEGKGTVMIMNYKTGEVLCLTSAPSIDPAYPAEEPEEGAYMNRALSATYTPGSTFKLVTAAAAIENIPDIYNMQFKCEGKYDIAGIEITCDAVHGTQSFPEAMANSCNCAFAQITVMLGQNTMVKYVNDFGFLSPHSIDGLYTSSGNYPQEFVGDPELAWSGIGQSTDQVCPYTMLRYVAAIANGGVLAEPTLLLGNDAGTTTVLDSSTAGKLRELMMNNVATHYEGDVRFPGLKLGAKTGTAETGYGTSHSWFTGFLADEAHPYAFVAIVEEGGYGLWTAGIMMNEILQHIVNNT